MSIRRLALMIQVPFESLPISRVSFFWLFLRLGSVCRLRIFPFMGSSSNFSPHVEESAADIVLFLFFLPFFFL